MLCPSISLTRFEQLPLDRRPCPCEMVGCDCIKTSTQPPATDILPRQADRWVPASQLKRNKNARPKNACVTVTRKYTTKAIANLFKAGIRFVHIQMAYGTKEEIEQLALRVCTEIAAHHLRDKKAEEITLAVEIRGRVVRTGRTHNDTPVELTKGSQIFITSNREYEHCSSKDVIYIHNLDVYLRRIQVGEFIFINRYEIQLVVVKVTYTTQTLTCCVILGSKLESYSPVILPYLITGGPDLLPEEVEDCEFAMRHTADFIVVPTVSDVKYLRSLRIESNRTCAHSIYLLSQLDESSFENNLAGLEAVMSASDGLWFSRTPKKLTPFMKYTIEQAREIGMPVLMGYQPLKNELPPKMLYDCDSFLLTRFNLYLGQTLQHKQDKYFKCTIPAEVAKLKSTLIDSNQTVSVAIGCTTLAALLLQSQLIICISKNGTIAIRLAQLRPACTILTILPSRRLARLLNIFKNVLPMVYKDVQSESNVPQNIQTKLSYALGAARQRRLIIVGDLVVMCFDVADSDEEDMISYQTIYVPEETVQA